MKKKSEYVSVYLRNEIEEPASYYRISQYLHKIDGGLLFPAGTREYSAIYNPGAWIQ